MPYLYDIFVSYRRNPETHAWITDHFLPLLEVRVEFELGRKPKIFVDSQIESGTSWPAALGKALGASRILIPLWTGNYLSSKWCTEEFSQMLGRESAAGMRSAKNPHGLIVPAFIHDGDKFPKALQHIQHFEIQDSFNLRMEKTSKKAAELDAALAAQAPAIATCIKKAPAWRKTWAAQSTKSFYKKFHQKESVQTKVPRFTTP